MEFSEEQLNKFWSFIEVKTEDECWEWIGCKNRDGYGLIQVNKVRYLSHRLSYLLANDELPTDLCLHSCDNPPCVNPKHLRNGTLEQNVEDRVARGRGRGQLTTDMVLGVKNPNTNLTEENVKYIRQHYKKTHYHGSNAKELMKQFGIKSKSTFHNIISRATWSHI